MVVVHNTSSEFALQMYDVSLKYSNDFQVIEGTRFCDVQSDGSKGIDNMSPDHFRGET